MSKRGQWYWNIEQDEFVTGDFFWNCLYKTYADIFTSVSALKNFFNQTELDAIKEAIERAIIRSEDTVIKLETSHELQNPSATISLIWEAEVLKTDEKTNALFVAGQVLSSENYKNKELQLPDNPEFYQQLMDNLPDSVFYKDLESRFIAINEACAIKFGLNDPTEAIGKTDFDFFNVEHAQIAFEDEQNIIETGESIIHKTEKETYTEDNRQPTWTSTSKFPLYDSTGTIIGTFGIATDITDLKRTNQQNKRLKSQLQAIFDTDPNMIFVKDFDGKYVHVNQAKADFHDMEKSEIIGKTDVELGVDPEEAEQFMQKDHFVIKEKQPFIIPDDVTYDNAGNKMWYHTIKVPFQLVDSEDLGALSIVSDITEHKQRELQLNETLDIISQQNKSLLNFAHIVSHNLRNHAGTISMILELLNMEDSKEEKDKLIKQLETASARLKGTIADLNEIIDEQYKSGTAEKEMNLSECFEKTRQILTTEIKEHEVEFKTDIPEDLNFTYNPAYLESILLNLTTNAIKYRHPDCKPVIELKAEEKDGHVHLIFRDNGKGIDLDKFGKKLFGMYQTFHGNENAKGIGLFITKNQIETMGGSIDVESEPGKGTTFNIQLN